MTEKKSRPSLLIMGPPGGDFNRILQAGADLAGGSDKTDILSKSVARFADLMRGDICLISIWHPVEEKFELAAGHPAPEGSPLATSLPSRTLFDHPLQIHITEEKKSGQISDMEIPVPDGLREILNIELLKSWLTIPLLGSDQQLLGVVDVLQHKNAVLYGKSFLSTVELFTQLIAAAFERAVMTEEIAERSRRFTELINAISSVSASLSLNQVLDQISNALTNLLGVGNCAISTYDERLEAVILVAENHPNDYEIDSFWYEPFYLKDFPVTAEVIRENKVVQLRTDMGDIDPTEKEIMDMDQVKSLLMAPLETEGNVVGLIELIDHNNYRTYSQEEINMVKILAGHAARAIENANVYETEKKGRKFSEALIQAAKGLNASLKLEEVLDRILEQTMSFLKCRGANLMLVEGETARVVRHLGYGDQAPEGRDIQNLTLPVSLPSLKQMLVDGKPLLIPNTEEYPGWDPIPGTEWVRSYVATPLVVEDNVIGFLNLDHEVPNFFNQEMVSEIEAFAVHASLALQNARLFKSIEDEATSLETIRRASLNLTASLELEDVLHSILEQSLQVIPGMYNGHIFLYQEGRLVFGSALNQDGTAGRIFAEPRPEGLTYTVARGGKAIVINDMQNHPIYKDAPPDWKGSIVGLPIKIGDRVVGVMNISHPETEKFKDNDLRILQLLADQAAISIINARLHRFVQDQSRTDTLTGLNNRRAFNERLEEEIRRSKRYNRTFSLAIMDLDQFKQVNDTFGHVVGDEVLTKIGACLGENVRNTDFLARYGGDEFALIMPETQEATATQLTGRIQQALQELNYELPHQPIRPISLSIGLAVYPEHARSLSGLIRAADKALYESKNSEFSTLVFRGDPLK